MTSILYVREGAAGSSCCQQSFLSDPSLVVQDQIAHMLRDFPLWNDTNLILFPPLLSKSEVREGRNEPIALTSHPQRKTPSLPSSKAWSRSVNLCRRLSIVRSIDIRLDQAVIHCPHRRSATGKKLVPSSMESDVPILKVTPRSITWPDTIQTLRLHRSSVVHQYWHTQAETKSNTKWCPGMSKRSTGTSSRFSKEGARLPADNEHVNHHHLSPSCLLSCVSCTSRRKEATVKTVAVLSADARSQHNGTRTQRQVSFQLPSERLMGLRGEETTVKTVAVLPTGEHEPKTFKRVTTQAIAK